MMERYQQLLKQLLDEEPLKSTWFYQDEALAAIEQAVYEAMLFDELFDEQDVWHRVKAKGFADVLLERVCAQLEYMALADGEQRLIFHDVLLEMYQSFTQLMLSPAPEARVKLSDCLRAVALEVDENGKIKRYVNEYVYLPKMLVLMLASHAPESYADEQRCKLEAIKPKFAKFYFNSCLDMLKDLPEEIASKPIEEPLPASGVDSILSIEAQAEDLSKRKIYRRIK